MANVKPRAAAEVNTAQHSDAPAQRFIQRFPNPFRLSLVVQYATRLPELPTRAEFRRWARAALVNDAQVTLRLVDEAEGKSLNRDYRGKDYATNVLTFAYGADAETGALSGDIVLCAPVIAREAREQGKPLVAHYAHMVVHAMLHLQGYDHEETLEAAAMEALEGFIMKKLGYSDPYHDRRQ